MIDAVDIEFPRAATVESGLNGDAVTDLPVETFRGSSAHDGTLAILEKGVPLVVRNDQLWTYLALIFWIDTNWGKKFFSS